MTQPFVTSLSPEPHLLPQPVHLCRPGNTNHSTSDQASSHKIEFNLGTSQPKVNAVVGASQNKQKIDSSIQNNLVPHLRQLGKSGTALISFGSHNSFHRITANKPDSLHTNSSSMVEQILRLRHSGGGVFDELEISGLDWKVHNSENSLEQWLTGEIQIRIKENGAWQDKKIQFQEFSPLYDGICLKSKIMESVLEQLPNEQTQSKNGSAQAHFYSANGIGRSASLAVLYAFRENCIRDGGYPEESLTAHLNTLVAQGRKQRNRHFVNTERQQEELLKAFTAVNESVRQSVRAQQAQANTVTANATTAATAPATTFPASPPANDAAPATPAVNETIKELVENGPGLPPAAKLPYMPITVEGISKIANDANKFPFPALSVETAKQYAEDVMWAGFYGDALGADLEKHPFTALPVLTGNGGPPLDPKQTVLFQNMDSTVKEEFSSFSTTAEIREDILIKQLKKTNLNGHHATDDTQQGVLSMNAQIKLKVQGETSLDKLGESIRDTFSSPKLPAKQQNLGEEPTRVINITDGAGTLKMCQRRKKEQHWYDQCISKRGNSTSRAEGAGNGGLMRIGYDLLPLLASGASMQNLVEHALISNQVTHPSSFSAVASVGQVVLMAKCMHLRHKAKKEGEALKIPPNFFIDTFYDVARALEHTKQRFGLDDSAMPPQNAPDDIKKNWHIPRFPSQFLKSWGEPQDAKDVAIQAGSVEQALQESRSKSDSYIETDLVLQRWASRSYLAATFPSIVFMLERYGYGEPARAVDLTALLTKDSDTCATIVAQVMGALYGSSWVKEEMIGCQGLETDLGSGFTVDQAVTHVQRFLDLKGKPIEAIKTA